MVWPLLAGRHGWKVVKVTQTAGVTRTTGVTRTAGVTQTAGVTRLEEGVSRALCLFSLSQQGEGEGGHDDDDCVNAPPLWNPCSWLSLLAKLLSHPFP